MLYKEVLTSVSVDEILKCDHSQGPRSIFSFGGGGGLKLMGAGGVNLKQMSLALAFERGSGACPPRKILTDMSSKMAKNASKYVRRNA